MYAQKLIAESGATRIALSVLTKGKGVSPPQLLGCMRLLRVLSKAGDNAKQIAAADELDDLFQLFEQPLSEPTLALAVESTWNLLDNELEATSLRLGTVECVETLTRLHERTMARDTCDTDKELRNEVLVVGTRLAQSSPEARAALVMGGFFRATLQLVCGGGARGVRLVKPTLVNLELLQLALHFLQVMFAGSSSSVLPAEAFEQLSSLQLPAAMAELLDPELARAATIWSDSQLQELRLRAMTLLSNMAMVHPDELAALPRLAPVLLEYITTSATPELRDGALHILVDALPMSPALQQQLGEAVPCSHPPHSRAPPPTTTTPQPTAPRPPALHRPFYLCVGRHSSDA